MGRTHYGHGPVHLNTIEGVSPKDMFVPIASCLGCRERLKYFTIVYYDQRSWAQKSNLRGAWLCPDLCKPRKLFISRHLKSE